MPRGRPSKVSDTRLLLEVLLQPENLVFQPEIAENVELTGQQVGNRMESLIEQGWIETHGVEGRNVYRLTDAGYEHLAAELRALVD